MLKTYTVPAMMKPPAESATPLIMSKPSHNPHGYWSVRLVVYDRPNKNRLMVTPITAVHSAAMNVTHKTPPVDNLGNLGTRLRIGSRSSIGRRSLCVWGLNFLSSHAPIP